LLLAWQLRGPASRPPLLRLACCHAGAVLVAWACIWAFFGFAFRPGGHVYLSILPRTPLEHAVAALDRWHALPEPFLRETLAVEWLFKPRPSYLLGHFKLGGYWYYFPVAFLAKSTLGMLLALASWLALARGPRRECGPPGMAALGAGSLAYALAALLSPLNIGVRHILPLYFFAAIAGGAALAQVGRRGAPWRGAAAAVALLAAAEGCSGWRQPLAWFNALWGGPMNGYRIMTESSLEWGGDLPQLAAWEEGLRTRDKDSPVYVCLLGPSGFEHVGVHAADMAYAFELGRVEPGYFVFGATRLEGGPWSLYGAWNGAAAGDWNANGADAWHAPLRRRLAQLAVARLAASCRAMAPTERIGPVYFVYHLDAAALEAALGKAPAP
jgi:hypothetical protein